MRHSQRGVTFIGWLFLLVPVAIVVYCGHSAYADVSELHARRQVAGAGGQRRPRAARAGQCRRTCAIRSSKHFDIESIEHPTSKDIDIHREGDHWVAIADYEDVAPMFGNISLLVQFHKQVDMQ